MSIDTQSETMTPVLQSGVIVLPDRLSYSQSATLQRCGWQWVLERGFDLPSQPSWATVGGSAVHTATEHWDNWTLAGEWVTDRTQIDRLFHEAFDKHIAERQEESPDFPVETWRASGRATKAYPDKENHQWWRDNGPGMVASWVTWRTNNAQWEIITTPFSGIETEFRVPLGGVDVKGYIDRVFHRNQTEVLVVDLKSGSYTPDDETQLGTYSVGLEEQYGVTPTWGAFWMARKGGTETLHDMRLWPKVRLDDIYRKSRRLQEEALFLPKKSTMCSGCSVRQWCIAANGEKSDLVPTPWETTVAQPLTSLV